MKKEIMNGTVKVEYEFNGRRDEIINMEDELRSSIEDIEGKYYKVIDFYDILHSVAHHPSHPQIIMKGIITIEYKFNGEADDLINMEAELISWINDLEGKHYKVKEAQELGNKWYKKYKRCVCGGCDDCTIGMTAKGYWKKGKSEEAFNKWYLEHQGCDPDED